MVFSHENVKS